MLESKLWATPVNAGLEVTGGFWEKEGPPLELTSLIPASANMHIVDAININDAGEIAAAATLANGDQHAVLLIPCDEHHPSMRGCELGEDRAPDDLGHFLPVGQHSGAESGRGHSRSKFLWKR